MLHGELRDAVKTRALRTVRAWRGVRPRNVSRLLYIGGNPDTWEKSGCNPSRFSAYPSWDPAIAVRRQPQQVPASSPYFVYAMRPNAVCGGSSSGDGAAQEKLRRCASRSLSRLVRRVSETNADVVPVFGKNGVVFWSWGAGTAASVP